MACDLCGFGEQMPVSEKDRHGNPLKTVLCRGCGVITNDPIPSADELVTFYSEHYRKDYKGAALPRMRQVYRNFRRLAAHFDTNKDIYAGRQRGLDLGSGSGEFLFLARKAGIDIEGIEPSVDYSEYSRTMLDLPVTTGTLEEAGYSDGRFDLIRLSHVLEHMRDPVTSLKTLRGWLNDEGVLSVEVPNIERDAIHRIRGQLFHYGHIYNFNPLTLRLAAARAGLVETGVSADRYSGTTTAFFQKTEPFSFDGGELKANAEQMAAVMKAHNERLVPQPKEGTAIGQFFARLGERGSEVIAAKRYSDQRAIADYFGSKVAALYE